MDPVGKLVVNLTQGSVVCDDVVIADRARPRMRGLLGRESIAPGEGMLLQPAPSIHTAFMRFSIDAVFVDGTLRVKKLVERLRPWRVASARRSLGVLELAAGEIVNRGIEVGDQLGVVEVSDELGAMEHKASWDRWSWSSVVGFGGDGEAVSGGHAPAPVAEATLDRGRPDGMKVLVVGADRRFRSVAAALLTRRGCAVTLGDRTSSISELASREGSEVVVLDAGLSLTEAARAAAQIEATNSPVGLVIVGEDPEQRLSTMPVLPKWGSFDSLYDAVEQARPGSFGSPNGGGH